MKKLLKDTCSKTAFTFNDRIYTKIIYEPTNYLSFVQIKIE